MSWVGESPGYESGQWIASRATLTNLFAGQFVEFRLINANLGRECTGGGWDVSYVRVNGFAPEPDGATLAAAGSVLSATAYLVRRHRRRRGPCCCRRRRLRHHHHGSHQHHQHRPWCWP